MLQAKDLSYQYSASAPLITKLSLTIPDHQITSIVGPNGSGKSTLFKLLTRAIQPMTGKVLLNNHDIWQLTGKEVAKQIAVVHQHHDLYDDLTVADLVRFGHLPYQSLLSDLPEENYNTELLLNRFGLTSLKDSYVRSLSGGQQQRVWLALALNQQPAYLFLDEPTTYLDLHYQIEFLKLLHQLNADEHLTIIMIIHDLNQALQYSDYCLFFNHGKIIAEGKPEEVLTPKRIEEHFKVNCKKIQTADGPILYQY